MIDDVNESAAEMAPVWCMMRHVLAGSHEMRENASEYIPRLSDQTNDEYKAYVTRPAFFEATKRTREALTGIIFRRAPIVEGLDGIPDFLTDVDGCGSPLEKWVSSLVDEQMATNWGAIVVSHSGDPANPGSADNPSGRPTMRYYPAESIIDWTRGPTIGPDGKRRRGLASIRFMEEEELPGADEFSRVCIEQIRVMDMDAQGFRERIFRKSDDPKQKDQWVQFSVAYPIKAGARLRYVPCVIVSGTGDEEPESPSLTPVGEINVSHWRTSADLEHAAHFCGLPTPYVTGVSAPTQRGIDALSALDGADGLTGFENIRGRNPAPQEPSIRLGSTRVMTLENPNAKAGFMEFTGQGVSTIERLLDRKEAQMAMLGARMLAPEKSAVESGDALAIRKASETAPLVKISNNVSAAVTMAANIACDWAGQPQEALVELNSEFEEAALSPEEMSALLATWQGGGMSQETMLYNFKRGKRIPDDVSVMDEIERIQNDTSQQRSIPYDPFAPDPNAPPIPLNGGGA